MAKANLCCRMGERVMILLSEFDAHSFEDLFQGVKATPLERFIPKDGAFPVKGYSLNSQLHSVPDCQAIVKKAAVDPAGREIRPRLDAGDRRNVPAALFHHEGSCGAVSRYLRREPAQARLPPRGQSCAAARDDGGRHGESGPVSRAGFLLGPVLRLGDHLHRGGDDRAEPRAGAEPVVHGPEMVLRARRPSGSRPGPRRSTANTAGNTTSSAPTSTRPRSRSRSRTRARRASASSSSSARRTPRR